MCSEILPETLALPWPLRVVSIPNRGSGKGRADFGVKFGLRGAVPVKDGFFFRDGGAPIHGRAGHTVLIKCIDRTAGTSLEMEERLRSAVEVTMCGNGNEVTVNGAGGPS